jgi:HD-like signal output (HDOD) protein/CheY-like chemotaxis protein
MSEPQSTKDRPVILFVDDDQRVLDGLSASLRRQRKQWSMEFLCGGACALRRLEDRGYDAVVTDMRMPGTDGEAVLSASRQHHPGALRIVLSGQTDRAGVRRTIAIAHRFLSKPCSAEELQASLQQLLDASVCLDRSTRDVVLSVGNLPASTAVLARLTALLNDGAPEPAEVSACIEQDVGLAAKLLHVAGAGFFAQPQVIKSLAKAVNLLGVETTAALLLSLESYSLEGAGAQLFARSEATARLLRRMLDSEEARLCAALHGVGRLVLLTRFGADYAALLQRAASDPAVPLDALERERFGMSHDRVGAHLLHLWGAPSPVVDAIRALGRPELAVTGTGLARALYIADALVEPGERIAESVRKCPDVAERIAIWQGWADEIVRTPS